MPKPGVFRARKYLARSLKRGVIWRGQARTGPRDAELAMLNRQLDLTA